VRHAWLTRQLLADPGGAAAHRRGEALGRTAHETLLAAGDRLAATSPRVAEQYYRHAAVAWTRLGADGFARWLALGEDLIAGEPSCAEAAVGFFAVSPGVFGADGLVAATRWVAGARRLAARSRRLAGTFVGQSAAVVGRPGAGARLDAFVDAALELHGASDWHGAFLAQGWVEAAAAVLGGLGPHDYAPLARTALALASTTRDRDLFTVLPGALAGWSDAERARLLGLVGTLASAAPRHALAVARALPGALAALDGPARAGVLAALAALDARVAPELAEVAPVVGALAGAVPAAHRVEAVALVAELAARFPEAALAALKSLPRVYEEAAPAAVRRWIEAGAAVAEDNPRAGRAYFALESRTGLRVLAAASTAAVLEETQGVWRKLVHMLSGRPARTVGVERGGLRPPLEHEPDGLEVSLPERIDLFPTHEENCRLYRVLAGQLAGRRVSGTYAIPALAGSLTDPEAPELLEDLFLVAEGVRVHHRVAARYPGLAADARWAGERLMACWAREAAPSRTVALDTLLALVLRGGREGLAALPPWLGEATADAVLALLAPLAAPEATVHDALRTAHLLVAVLTEPRERRTRREAEMAALSPEDLGILDPTAYGDDDAPVDAPAPLAAVGPGEAELPEGLRLELAGPDDEGGEGRPLSLEELKRLLAAGVEITQAVGDGDAGPGLPLTDLLGKLPAAELARLRALLAAAEGPARPRRRAVDEDAGGTAFLYDEWDEDIGDYRSRWCRLLEVDVAGDSGEYFARTLADYARLIPEVRRQFQLLRPEMYRTIRGLEDGEDFDLNAVIDARTERRAGCSPSTKLYRSRVREARDVATLFLLDMSASTDEPLDKAADRGGRRIIDVTKEALVIMTEALDELGDAYAIYGFSGQGRANVEFYPVKGFNETLGSTVQARIGGIEPRRSTRMGTALRHAITKLAAVGARSKHIILLSDGFPQDMDYGEDRRSHAYGIRDTAVALREAEAVGITPFCITVDRAGHDYLRQMCEESRYLVIEDVGALPRELPKIYQRVVRA
jgi:nitric oxide reductase NorD protein